MSPVALLRVLSTMVLCSVPRVQGQAWHPPPVAHAQPHSQQQQQQGFYPAQNQWNSPHGSSGSAIVMQQDRLMAQQLGGGQRRMYEITVPKGGSVGITVHPERGAITWNITHDNVYMMKHPLFTHVLSAPLPSYSGPSSRFKRTSARSTAADGAEEHSRSKRQLYSGAVRSNFDFDVTELNAGYGRSIGVGSINYIKEDMGGVYTMEVANRRMNQVASFYIYATLNPSNSPYPRIPDDPQARVVRLESGALNVEWQPVRSQYQPRTEYCVFYHAASSHTPSDVHSSPYAHQLRSGSTVRERCNRRPFARLNNLRPMTEYHIDVMARDLTTQRMTTYIGVKAATLSRMQQRHQVAYERQHNPPSNNNNNNHHYSPVTVPAVAVNNNNNHGLDHPPPPQHTPQDLVSPDLLPPNQELFPEEVLVGEGHEEEHILPHDGTGNQNSGSASLTTSSSRTSMLVVLLGLCVGRLVMTSL